MRLLAVITLIAHSGSTFVSANGSLTLGRIIRGHDAMLDQFPYVVRLSVRSKNPKKTVCGGALISPTWVLTAGHCVANCNSVKVHLGCIFKDRCTVAHDVKISDITVHPHFKSRGPYHDIALIKIPFNEMFKITIVRLPRISRSYPQYEKAYAIICGWGKTAMRGKSSKRLQWGRVQILARDDCPQTTQDELCTAMGSNLATPYLGDSGGPLVLEGSGELVGIASCGGWESGENGNLMEAIYTRVTSYLHWIKSVSSVSYRSSI